MARIETGQSGRTDTINPRQWFEEQKELHGWRTIYYKGRVKLLSWLRLLAFLAGTLVPVLLFPFISIPFFTLTTLFLSLFIILVRMARQMQKKAEWHQVLEQLNKLELDALAGNFIHFKGDGENYINPHHFFSFDLDLFGRGSLFQLVNRTVFAEGEARLAQLFNNPGYSIDDIRKRQETLAELAQSVLFRQRFYALSALGNHQFPITEKIRGFSALDTSFLNTAWLWISRLFPWIAASVIILVAVNVLSGSYLLYVFLIGMTLSGLAAKRVSRIHQGVSEMSSLLNQYSQLFELCGKSNFEAVELKNVVSQFDDGNDQCASKRIKELSRTTESLDLRLNFLVAAVLNGFLLWDIRQCFKVKNWIRRHSREAITWFDALHTIEAFNSLAGYMFSHPDFAIPQLSNEVTLNTSALGHPMIEERRRVCNDFQLADNQKIVILTGANMAGKSTFLRTVGINYLLACMGSTVCAQSFEFNPIPLISNMRTSDSLLRQESYFFAEMKRLQLIVNEIKTNGPHFFILDEILKGTNSVDKTKGSRALVKKLLVEGGIGLIATHDLELGEMQDEYQGRIVNHCFEVTQHEGRLLFDYKLRNGITHSHNATYLLMQMGLMDEE